MCKNFRKLCKKCSINLIGRDFGGLWLKKKFRLGYIRGKEGLLRDYNNKISSGKNVFVTYHCKKQFIFLTRVPRVSTYEIDRTFFTLSKICTYFWDRGGRVCFMVYPVIHLKIVARQNYFYQNFHLKEIFPEIFNKTYFPFWNFKVPPLPLL